MKKSILTAVALMAVASAQAVTLNWSGNLATAKLLGLTATPNMTVGAGSETASMTVYYLLATDAATVQGTVDEATVAGLAQATATGQTSTSTGASGRFTSSTVIAGSGPGVSYFARVYATFGGQDYFIDLQNANTAFWTTAVSGNDTVTEQFQWGVATYGGSTGTLGDFNKWVAVPEPATAALALAGLAMLIRRRK